MDREFPSGPTRGEAPMGKRVATMLREADVVAVGVNVVVGALLIGAVVGAVFLNGQPGSADNPVIQTVVNPDEQANETRSQGELIDVPGGGSLPEPSEGAKDP